MPLRCALTAVFLIASARLAMAQTYDPSHPLPATTSGPALRSLAERREIHERFIIGLRAESEQNWKAAAAEFERILSLHPREPQRSTAHYDLALAEVGLNRLDSAASEFERAIALDSGFLAAFANLIAVDLMRKDIAGARTVADRFLRVAPQSARALYSRGIVALAGNDPQAAAADFGKLLLNSPSYAVAHYDLGLAETQLGRYDAAERELKAALRLAPNYSRAQFALGTVLLKEGKRSEARLAFDETIKTASKDPTLRNLATSMRDALHR